MGQMAQSNAALVDIYAKASLSRLFEARLVRLTNEGFVPPLLHPGAGHEVAQVAALAALKPDDPVLYSHRGVAYMVARDVELSAMVADMAGREGGTNNGKGGIMHVVDPAKGIFGESGTLGGSMVVAVGIAMALRRKRPGSVVVNFFGDGASNRGTFHEALNWAAVQRLPCLFICENNGWAVSVPTSRSTAVEDIADRAHGYGIPGVVLDGNDVDGVLHAVAAAADRARAGEGPSLIEIKVTRMLGHYAADPQDYRSDAAEAAGKDPLALLRTRLIDAELLDEAEIAAMESGFHTRIEEAVERVKAAPLLSGDAAFSDLYS